MRRVGKTYLCCQRIKELSAAGVKRENILYLNFEDDRLFGFGLADCQTILDVFYGGNSEKKSEPCYFFFDEIQNVPHWERFIRRLIDTERVAVYVSGSSAKLFSAEIATGLRGRSLDQEVFPFSFAEYLRTHSVSLNLARVGEKTRLKLNHHAQRYCRQGGLPEIQKLSPARSKEIAQSYVDAVVLRDVIDNGILDAYSTQITEDIGAFLENLVSITLRRRGHPLGYYETKKGHEIDFVYKKGETTVLVQVAEYKRTETLQCQADSGTATDAPKLLAKRAKLSTVKSMKPSSVGLPPFALHTADGTSALPGSHAADGTSAPPDYARGCACLCASLSRAMET